MIVIDTSALMAILFGEPGAEACRGAIDAQLDLLIAAPTLTETLVVAAGRKLHGEMARLIDDLALTVIPLSKDLAYAATRGYLRWGKGFHSAGLNLGDSLAYALAEDRACPLLYVGNDSRGPTFARPSMSLARKFAVLHVPYLSHPVG